MEGAGNLAYVEMGQGSREISSRAGGETRSSCALQRAQGGFKYGVEGALPPLCRVHLWPYDRSVAAPSDSIVTPEHLRSVNIQTETKTHFIIGQWVSGSDNHLQVSGSDNHLQAICARFGSQPARGCGRF